MKPGNLFYIRCQFLTDELFSHFRELQAAISVFFIDKQKGRINEKNTLYVGIGDRRSSRQNM